MQKRTLILCLLASVMMAFTGNAYGQTTVINTTDMASDIKGFNGPVPLEIHLKDGKVQKVVALRNGETSSYFQKASKLLTAWNGKTVKEASTMKVDGVTGATYSSNAIINTMRRGLASVQNGKTTTKAATGASKNASARTKSTASAKTTEANAKTTTTAPAKATQLTVCKPEEVVGTDPFHFFNRRGGLVLCAGNKEKSNAMAIGWGDLGTLWGQSVATVYVAQGRYTHEFMEKAEYFTIMSFDDMNVLGVMGSKSGRDMDKAKECGLTILYTENGTPYYAEATSMIECKIMYSATFDPSRFKDDVPKNMYSNFPAGLHTAYTGRIVKAMKK
ncbi:MAG: FMN-binding protein [Bacteroidaceae bacterium]|nr:FMN-binding protein [Bacteroidaceae bacterium]